MIEYKYDYLIIDAQYYLRRNWSVVSELPEFDGATLLSSFLFTILKIAKNYTSRKIILLWDKKPYKKEETIKNYKGDRYLVCADYDDTEKQADDIREKLKDTTLTEEERNKLNNILNELNKKIEQLEVEVNKFKIMAESKYEILCKFDNFGLVSLNIKGYEADDLAYLISLWCLENEKKCLLVSGDSDWVCMTNKFTDVCRWTKRQVMNTDYQNYLNIPDQFKDRISSFELYQLKDIYYGGHNNVNLDINRDEVSFDQFVEIALSNEDSDVKFYFDALRLNGYYDDYIKSLLTEKLTNYGNLNLNDYQTYQNEKGLMRINDSYLEWYYRAIVNKQDKGYFKHEE